MVRKSTRTLKRKWPCGTCSLQCNDNSIFCEGCQMWYHSRCENLSLRDLKVLQDLSEDYLCSSCTHVGGIFDFENALQRLTSATRVGRLESTATEENIFLRSAPVNQTISNCSLEHGLWTLLLKTF